MNSKKIILILVSLVLVAGIGFYFYGLPPIKYWTKNPTNFEECKEATRGFIIKTLPAQCEFRGQNFVDQSQQTPPVTTNNPSVTTTGNLSLSADKKSVVADGKVLLAIDNDTIFNWFKTESQLCDGYNLTSTPDRKMFCENKRSFENQTKFTSVVLSPDKMKIGFAIESNTLSPDKVVGIFLRSTNKVNILTNYYLGNEFISFSPSGANFVYQGGCFEGMCGLFIKNSESLANKASLNNPEFADYRSQNAIFVRWISDNQVEYKLGTELKRESF